jgi:hypothetical protein
MGTDRIRDVPSSPDPATRRELILRHRAELDAFLARVKASRDLLDHALTCPADDFTQCPAFQRLSHTPMPCPTEPELAP